MKCFFFLIQVFVVGVLKKKRKKFKKENFWKPCHDAKSTVWIWACTLKSDNKPKKIVTKNEANFSHFYIVAAIITSELCLCSKRR